MVTLTTNETLDKCFYINGTLTKCVHASNDNVNPNHINIGFRQGTGTRDFTGVIDEMGFWNRSLSQTEITGLYNNGQGVAYGNASILSISLNSPSDEAVVQSPIITFNATATSPTSLVNMSLWTNETGSFALRNITIGLSGASSTQVWTRNVTILSGAFGWYVQGCDTNGCQVSTTQTVNIAPAVLVTRSLNFTTYETAHEGFVANISSDAGLTSVTLNWSNTLYPTTQSGSYWNVSFDIPLNTYGTINMNWIMNYGGTNIATLYTNQTVNPINLTSCGIPNTINQTYTNYSFIDETTNLPISGSLLYAVNYYLGGGTVQKSILYNNATFEPNFPFCFTPQDRIIFTNGSITYAGNGYPQRTQTFAQSLSNITTNNILTLLSSSNGVYSQFVFLSSSDSSPVSGVSVTATRTISGVPTIVASGTSDSAGLVTFFLNPDFTHTLAYSRTGYDASNQSINPSSLLTTIFLTPSGSGNRTQTNWTSQEFPFAWTYDIQPGQLFLNSNTIYNFSLVTTSGGSLDVNMTISDENGRSLRFLSGSGTSNNLLTSLNVTNNQTIFGDFFIGNENVTYHYRKVWSIGNYDNNGAFSLKSFLEEFNVQGVGSNNILWVKMLIMFCTLIGIFYGLYSNTGADSIDSSAAALGGVTVALWGFSYVSWLQMDYFPFAWLNQYGIAMLSTLLSLALISWRFTER